MSKRRTYALFTPRKYFLVVLAVLLLFVLAAPLVLAQTGTEEGPLTERFTSGEGRYATVAGGAGLEGLSSNTVSLNVPGQAVIAAYLYWAGVNLDGAPDDPDVGFQVDGGAVNSITADVTYGPSFWYTDYGTGDTFNHNVYVEDVTSFVQLGTHNYTLSGYTVTGPVGSSLAYGFGLIVVYEDSTLPLANVTLLDGLDSVYYGFQPPQDSPSEVNCVTFEANTLDRVMDFTVFVGGSEDSGSTNRPNSLHYVTGNGALPGDVTGAPGNVEIIDPFTSADGDAWDTYSQTIVIPAGDTYACFQTQSDGDRGNGASFLWLMGGTTLREQTPTAVSLSTFSADNPVALPAAGVVLALLLLGSVTGLALVRRRPSA